ncbi:hypothetical protein [Salinisphaera sp.]|uniref:hypothetical protein n=1 Tax=Salinisphaera sp. TaxID=1914330 RepID=UPI000C37F722|nr:hypothetical protein [Salinisphaera sp.]MAS10315.1 hypothetical protein [Salinisphaera sp.]|tara:strand:+ start:3548 stop:3811 length:264 start_codon:yes stop_codon:yes gene_type:complete
MSNSKTKPYDPIAESLIRLSEIQATIQGIAEIHEEIDISRVCDDGLPKWWTQRHEAGLIGAVKFLAAHSLGVVEGLQARHESSEGDQ